VTRWSISELVFHSTKPTASVMAIKSEVFGSCVEGIDVYVEVECAGESLCCG